MLASDKQHKAIKALSNDYSKALKLDHKKVNTLIKSGMKELEQFAKTIQFDFEKSHFYQQIMARDDPEQTDQAQTEDSTEYNDLKSVKVLLENTDEQIRSSDKALSDGIQQITNNLTDDFSINHVMQMILETIYRAFPNGRVILCLKDKNTTSIRARFGYGEGVDDIIDKFVIPVAYRSDVFHVAFKNGVDIQIEDISDENIRAKIPDWYQQNIGAKNFIIFPISIKKSPIAFIYIESADNDATKITDDQLGKLKTLRNQSILAIKASH
ncbi:MAG: hypothetical protein ACI9LO_001601 [Planctomycetota bacterium]|jgi:hypothetical protein